MPWRAQRVWIADAGQHQHLRRIDHAAGHDHLAVGAGHRRIAAPAVFDADRAAALDQHPRHQRAGLHGEVAARHRRAQIGDRRAAALAVADGVLVAADAVVLRPVEVVVPFQARPLRRLDIGIDQRLLERGEAHAERAVGAAIGTCAALPGLLLAEVGQRMRVGPARQVVLLGPAVVVAAVAARIGHGVDRGRAADHLAARAFDVAAVQLRLGLGEIHPVVQPPRQDAAPAERDVDPWVAVPAAGFEDQDLDVLVLGQPVRQHAAGGAGTDDDVVEGLDGRCHAEQG